MRFFRTPRNRTTEPGTGPATDAAPTDTTITTPDTDTDKAAWTYSSVDTIPNVWSAGPSNCRGRRHLRTTSANALLVYEALQREAKS